VVVSERTSLVDYDVDDGCARILLNRPHRLNAVVPELVEDLSSTLERAIADGVAVAILAGRGKAFCAGFDLKADRTSRTPAEHLQQLNRIQDVTRLLRRAPFPVISAVHGYALGNGCEFALAADLVVASEEAMFGFPEVSWGLGVTGGVTALLPLIVGLHRAKALVMLGERFSAMDAAAIGLVHRVVPAGQHLHAAAEVAASLARQPANALTRAKRALDASYGPALEAAYQLEIEHALAAGQSTETAEAIARYDG
jgi:enoyl-CoA hydratase/carnithine racemase